MNNNFKKIILENIGRIHDKSEKCRLETSFFDSIDTELLLLSDYFGTTKSQSFFIAVIFSLAYSLPSVDLNDIAEHFECNPMKLLQFNEDFEHLHKKGILKKDRMMHMPPFETKKDQYSVNEKITEAILKDKPMPSLDKTGVKDVIDLLGALYELGNKRDEEIISSIELFRSATEMINKNQHFPLVQQVLDFQYHIHDTYLLLYLIWEALSGNESCQLGRVMAVMFDRAPIRVRQMQEFYSSKNNLVKNRLVELVAGGFLNDTEIKLTGESADILEDNGLKLFSIKRKRENVINPKDIAFKKLLFDENKMKQLYTLKELLQEGNLRKTCERLAGKGLPKGINVILHGLPGTGKTEAALQLAKNTGRDIMKVEISQSKSMWFGESEKLIKRIFTNYKAYSKECEKVPILLFNEADALLGKRLKSGNSGTSQTENAIQNILLEELENFDGILIATTNLAGNLDTAFERRFLFKIEFDKPDISIRAMIWKAKIPGLSEDDCNCLATKFDFSGGQIENIARKCEIHEIIHGIKVDLKGLIEFCQDEILERRQTKIGFTFS